MRRVLFLCQEFYPEQVGTGKSMSELAEEFVRRGIAVDVVCAQPTLVDRDRRYEARMTWRGIGIRRIGSSRFAPATTAGKLANSLTFTASAALDLLAHTGDCPILVTTTPPFLMYAATLARVLQNRRFVVRVGDVYPSAAINAGALADGSWAVAAWDVFNEWSFARAEKVIVLGRCMEQALNARYGDRYADKLATIHVWGDDDTILAAEPGDENPLAAGWGIADRFVALYSGNMGRTHDVETIIEAARRLRDRDDILFLMVCGGYKRPLAERLARDLPNVRFEDYVSRDEYPRLLAAADVGITSLIAGQEGLSVPSKSYGMMCAGLPIVALMSASAEVARVVADEDCGVVVRPGHAVGLGDAAGLADAILELKNDPARRRRLGENGARASREKYSLRIAADRYLELLEPLM